MSKNRYVNTKIWSDSYFLKLDPTEKLLFLYLLTNEKTNICGIYELPLKIMSTETGIEKEMIENILKRFEISGKIKYVNEWVALKNFIKHQDQGSPTVKKGIANELKKAPELLITWVLEGMDTLCHLNINLNLTKSNLNLNTTNDTQSIKEKYSEIFNKLSGSKL